MHLTKRNARLLALFAPTLLAGCSLFSGQEAPSAAFDSVVVQNDASGSMHAVEVVIPGTGETLPCGSMAPGDACRQTIVPMEYPTEPLVLNWQYAGEGERTIPLPIQKPADFDASARYAAVIEIRSGGIFAANWVRQP